MRVLILGGTGAMGQYLVELLKRDNTQTVVTTRSYQEQDGSIRYLSGNAHDRQFLLPLLNEKWDVIVDFMIYSTDAFLSLYVSFLKSTNQYFYLSSARVYADSLSPITEDSPRLLDICKDTDYLKTDEYALAKARQEDALRGAENNNWTIVRPYITYGKSRLQLGVYEKEAWLYRAMHRRSIIISEEIASKKTTITHGIDVARCIKAMMGNKEALGQTYNLTGGCTLLWSEILDIYLRRLAHHGIHPKVKYVSSKNFLYTHHSFYQIYYDRLYDRFFDTSKLNGIIDPTNFDYANSGIEKCFDSFLKNPKFLPINWGLEAIKDKYASEFTSPFEIKNFRAFPKYFIKRIF